MGVNAFQHTAFQQVVGKVAFQLFTGVTVGGRTFEQQKWWNSLVEARKVQDRHDAAVALGRLGGLVGGKARADSLSKKQLSSIATRAAKARWS